jgi:hypothetical protein
VLLAYIDEIGETGAFVSRDHPRFNTSPAFGYAGFVIPAEHARRFGSIFTEEKRRVFKTEIEAAANPGQWERKGADIFRPETPKRFPQQLRVFNGLVRRLRELDGHLFYYADEKPIGTPKQTQLDTDKRETAAMRESLNRLARHADSQGHNLMVMIDQINERQRSQRIPNMYAHILGRAAEYPEMQRIIEPPMHVDSVLSANIQFADWVAACVTRAVEYQTLELSPFGWITSPGTVGNVRGSFTHESKLHLWNRSVGDPHHSELFRQERPIYPLVRGYRLGASIDPAIVRRLRGITN